MVVRISSWIRPIATVGWGGRISRWEHRPWLAATLLTDGQLRPSLVSPYQFDGDELHRRSKAELGRAFGDEIGDGHADADTPAAKARMTATSRDRPLVQMVASFAALGLPRRQKASASNNQSRTSAVAAIGSSAAMACCIVLSVLVAAVRRLWFALPGTGEAQDPGFAPPARRQVGGFAASAELQVATPTEVEPSQTAVGGSAWRGFAVASGSYALILPILAAAGAVTLSGSAVAWIGRSALLALLAAAALLAPARSAAGHRSTRAADTNALCAAGAALWLWGLLDMHLFGLLEVAGGAAGWDIAFHAVGPLLAAAGLWVVTRTDRDGRARRRHAVPPARAEIPVGARS